MSISPIPNLHLRFSSCLYLCVCWAGVCSWGSWGKLRLGLVAVWGEGSQWWLAAVCCRGEEPRLIGHTHTSGDCIGHTHTSVPHLPWPCWRTMPPSAQRCRLMQSDVWAKNLSVCSSCKFKKGFSAMKTANRYLWHDVVMHDESI